LSVGDDGEGVGPAFGFWHIGIAWQWFRENDGFRDLNPSDRTT